MGPNVINEITVIAHVMIQVLSMPAKVAVVAVDPISVVGMGKKEKKTPVHCSGYMLVYITYQSTQSFMYYKFAVKNCYCLSKIKIKIATAFSNLTIML
jgi:hypothetical protein